MDIQDLRVAGTSAQAVASSTPPFMKLSLEVRQMIYEYAISLPEKKLKPRKIQARNHRKRYVDRSHLSVTAQRLAAKKRKLQNINPMANLSLTCKLFRDDLLKPSFLYKDRTFVFTSPTTAFSYLESIGDLHRDSISSIELEWAFTWFSKPGMPHDRAFRALTKCNNLKRLSVNFFGPQNLRRYIPWDNFWDDSLRELKKVDGLDSFWMTRNSEEIKDRWAWFVLRAPHARVNEQWAIELNYLAGLLLSPKSPPTREEDLEVVVLSDSESETED